LFVPSFPYAFLLTGFPAPLFLRIPLTFGASAMCALAFDIAFRPTSLLLRRRRRRSCENRPFQARLPRLRERISRSEDLHQFQNYCDNALGIYR